MTPLRNNKAEAVNRNVGIEEFGSSKLIPPMAHATEIINTIVATPEIRVCFTTYLLVTFSISS